MKPPPRRALPRRTFLRRATLSGAGLALAPLLGARDAPAGPRPAGSTYLGGFAAAPLDKLRVAFIGVGARGGSHLEFLGGLLGTDIVAISDLYADNVDKWAAVAAGLRGGSAHADVGRYHGDPERWRAMLAEVRPDVLFIATDWPNHAPMAIAGMEAGAHVFVEVPLATTIDDLWAIVETAERTGRHCMMLENVNYGRDELLFLNMCRRGVIGELLHGEAAYIHDLRFQMHEVERGTGSWRTPQYARRDGNLYPTHGLGPVAQYMSLARGEDTFASLVSYSTPARGRQLYAEEHFPPEHRWNQLEFRGGDMNTSILKTTLGRTILVQWDETSPRPYSRLNLIQGTRGALAGFPTRVALEGGVAGVTDDHHSWVQGDDLAAIYERYEHPLYRRLAATTTASGHGGMDGMMVSRIVECLHAGLPLDQNVYEGASWSAVAPLSERSVAAGGAPQDFPDFTRGDWETTAPLGIVA